MSGPWPAWSAVRRAALSAGLSYQVILTVTPGCLASKFLAAFSRQATFAGSSASWLHMVIVVWAAAGRMVPSAITPARAPLTSHRRAGPLFMNIARLPPVMGPSAAIRGSLAALVG